MDNTKHIALKNYKLQITNYIKVGRGISTQVLRGYFLL